MNKNTYGFSAVILLVILLAFVVVGGAGWYVWNKNQQNNEVPVTTATTQEEKEESTSSNTVAIPANYKKYTNDTLGFSFAYPEDWLTNTISADASAYGTVACFVTPKQHATYNEFINSDTPTDGPSDQDVCVSHWDTINNEYARGGSWIDMKENYASLEELLKDPYASKRYINKITVNGKTAYEVSISGLSAVYGVMFETDKGIYEFGFANVNPDKTTTPSTGITPEILNTIVNSIEFN